MASITPGYVKFEQTVTQKITNYISRLTEYEPYWNWDWFLPCNLMHKLRTGSLQYDLVAWRDNQFFGPEMCRSTVRSHIGLRIVSTELDEQYWRNDWDQRFRDWAEDQVLLISSGQTKRWQ